MLGYVSLRSLTVHRGHGVEVGTNGPCAVTSPELDVVQGAVIVEGIERRIERVSLRRDEREGRPLGALQESEFE